MKKYYSSLATALLAISSLASCSRSNYAFQPVNSAYHGTIARAEVAPKQQSVIIAPTPAAESAPTAIPNKTPETVVTPSGIAAASTLACQAKATKKVKPVAAFKLAVVPKKVLNKLEQVAGKELQKKQNTASINQPAASKAGRAAIVAGVGLLLLLLGAVAGIGLVVLIGLLAFLVGVIMLIIALINGSDSKG